MGPAARTSGGPTLNDRVAALRHQLLRSDCFTGVLEEFFALVETTPLMAE